MNLISMNKKYKTRDGRDVRVLCVDACEGDFPVVAVVDNDIWQVTKYGMFSKIGCMENDLIEQQEEKTVWLEIYRYKHWRDTDYNGIRHYMSEQELRDHIETMKEDSKGYKLVAIKKITYVEGEGIE